MRALGKDLASVTQHIRNLRGGSQPILAHASDGLTYVVKFSNNLQGPNLPFNESAGSELYRACGLATPAWKPLLVTDSFLEKNPDCWMQTPKGPSRPNSGLCFGSRFLGGNGKCLFEIMPSPSFERVRNREKFWLAWSVDVCADHSDNRQAIFQEDAYGWLDPYFVDHGHMFGSAKGDIRSKFEASAYLDYRIYHYVQFADLARIQMNLQNLNTDRLWRRIHSLPDEWMMPSALDSFKTCLDRLSKPVLLRNVLDTLADSYERSAKLEQGNRKLRSQPASVLRPGVQSAGCDPNGVDDSACA